MSVTTKFKDYAHCIDGPHYSFDEAEMDAASKAWGCNCGPSALAAIVGMKLDAVRPHIPDFDSRHYTNPTMMKAALTSLGVGFEALPVTVPSHTMAWRGLVRIQWEGPWLNPGVPAAAAYRQTHWVASLACTKGTMIFDCNGGWCLMKEWEAVVVPKLLEYVKRSTGWHTTHRWELRTFPEVKS